MILLFSALIPLHCLFFLSHFAIPQSFFGSHSHRSSMFRSKSTPALPVIEQDLMPALAYMRISSDVETIRRPYHPCPSLTLSFSLMIQSCLLYNVPRRSCRDTQTNMSPSIDHTARRPMSTMRLYPENQGQTILWWPMQCLCSNGPHRPPYRGAHLPRKGTILSLYSIERSKIQTRD